MGIAVAVSVAGISVWVAVAEGVNGVDVAGKVVTAEGLEQLTSRSKNKIQEGRSLFNFISKLTEYNILKFQI